VAFNRHDELILHLRIKFRANRINLFGVIAKNRSSDLTAVRHIGY